MPLAFVEVKKPNNQEGVLSERDRINRRFKNKRFRKFINVSQLFVFSNNMEYDAESIEPIQGVFYASPSCSKANFNCFREEESLDLEALLAPGNDDTASARDGLTQQREGQGCGELLERLRALRESTNYLAGFRYNTVSNIKSDKGQPGIKLGVRVNQAYSSKLG